MYKKLILLIFLVFGLGWFSHEIYIQFSNLSFKEGALLSVREKDSPHDWIKQEQIHISQDNVTIDIQNPQWAIFTDTNSMDPVIDEHTHAIEIAPQSKEDIHVGDIISYKPEGFDGILIHRVIEIGDDGEWYAVARGDNATFTDPGKIRFDQIERILVAIIY